MRSLSWGQGEAGLRGELKTQLKVEREGPPALCPPGPIPPGAPCKPQPGRTYRLGPWNPLPQGARQLLWAWEALALKQ